MSSSLVGRVFALILVLSILGGGALFPSLAARGQEPEPLLKVDTNLVTLDVVVTDDRDEYVRGLQAEDFRLFEDGKPRRIDFFKSNQSAEQRTVAMVFAVDFSGSVTPEELAMQGRAFSAFLKLQNPQSLFALIGFNEEVRVLRGFTRDDRKLLKAFEKFKDFGGSTRIYDAVDRAVEMLRKVPKGRGAARVRRYVVVLTDGFDNSSAVSAREVVRRANAEEVSVYTVTVPSYMMTVAGRRRVPTLLDASRLAAATGGKDFPVEAGKDYTEAFKAISTELTESYTLAYQPDEPNGQNRFHKLSVTTPRPGLRLRLSREGFVR